LSINVGTTPDTTKPKAAGGFRASETGDPADIQAAAADQALIVLKSG
jgi:hypothetical protein